MVSQNQRKESHIIQEQKFDKQKTKADIYNVLLVMTMHHKIKDLVRENIMLQRLTDLDNVPLHNYLELVKPDRLCGLELEIIKNAEDMLQELKTNWDIPRITNDCYFERLCDIFNLYFFTHNSKKHNDNGNYDDNGIPEFYPDTIRKFIKAAYPLFETIQNTKASYDFAGLLTAENYEDNWRRTYLNRIKILTLVLMGRIRAGRNITRLLFNKISGDTEIPESFKHLCRIKSGKYIICNTDPQSINFQLAVFDLIDLEDIDNKAFFNAKVNQYLAVNGKD